MGLTLFYRKLLSGLATILMTTVFFTLLFFILSAGDPESLLSSIGVVSYASVGVALYGLPVSILAEVLIPYKARTRWLYTLLIHIGFVIGPYLILKIIEPRLEISPYIAVITPVAFLYWLTDEGLIRWKPAFHIEEKKIVRILYGIGCGLVLLFSFSWVNDNLVEEVIPLAQYNIPEGHEGWVYVIYDLKGEPKLKVEDDIRIININEEGVAKTSTVYKGTAISENKYFYVDENGEKTLIPEHKIHFGPVSGYSDFDGDVEINYDVEAFFIGTKEELEESDQPDYSKYIPKAKPVDPNRDKYTFTLPEGYTGWVRIEVDPNVQNSDRAFEVNQEGVAVLPYDISSIAPTYDRFYYRDGDTLTPIPEEYVTEFYYFPDLTVFHVGPKEDLQPFKYEEYIKQSEENR